MSLIGEAEPTSDAFGIHSFVMTKNLIGAKDADLQPHD